MKTLMNIVAICLCVAVIGCESSQSTTAPANMGAVGECGSECASACCDKAAMGVVGDSKSCASSCSSKANADMGAMSDTPACSDKAASDCEKVCPMSGKVSDTSLGAVSEDTCSSKKSSCASSCGGK